eukprot:gene2501-2848_t
MFSLDWLQENYSDAEVCVRLNSAVEPERAWKLTAYLEYIAALGSQLTGKALPPGSFRRVSGLSRSGPSSTPPHGSPSTSSPHLESSLGASSPSKTNGPIYCRKDVICPPQWVNMFGVDGPLPSHLVEGGYGDTMPQKDTLSTTIRINIDPTEYWSPGTRAPSASIAHSLMVHGANEHAMTKFYCTASGDREAAGALWQRRLGITIENDIKYVHIPLYELLGYGVPIYKCEQRPGDLVIFPSCSIVEYTNHGGETIKASWTRMMSETVLAGTEYMLPIYRDLKKTDPMKLKLLALASIRSFIGEAEDYVTRCSNGASFETIPQTFVDSMLVAHQAFSIVLWNDTIDMSSIVEERQVRDPVLELRAGQPAQRTCHGCRTLIFNRAFACTLCAEVGHPPIDVCVDCMAEGDVCKHRNTVLYEVVPMAEYEALLTRSRKALMAIASFRQNHIPPLAMEGQITNIRSIYQTRISAATVAYNQVALAHCETKSTCHQCKLARPKHKIAYCNKEIPQKTGPDGKPQKVTKCQKKYCLQCLWNRYNCQLVDCLKTKNWECLFCQTRCNCSACLRKKPQQEESAAIDSPPKKSKSLFKPSVGSQQAQTFIWSNNTNKKKKEAAAVATNTVIATTSSPVSFAGPERPFPLTPITINIPSPKMTMVDPFKPTVAPLSKLRASSGSIGYGSHSPSHQKQMHVITGSPSSMYDGYQGNSSPRNIVQQRIMSPFPYEANELHSSAEHHRGTPPSGDNYCGAGSPSSTFHLFNNMSMNSPRSPYDRYGSYLPMSPFGTPPGSNIPYNTPPQQQMFSPDRHPLSFSDTTATPPPPPPKKNQRKRRSDELQATKKDGGSSTKLKSSRKDSTPQSILGLSSASLMGPVENLRTNNEDHLEIITNQISSIFQGTKHVVATEKRDKIITLLRSTLTKDQPATPAPPPYDMKRPPTKMFSGAIVWARLGLNSHYFPARVCMPEEIPMTTKQMTNNVYVCFFGDALFEWVESKNIIPFETGTEVYYVSVDGGKALTEALEYKKNRDIHLAAASEARSPTPPYKLSLQPHRWILIKLENNIQHKP